MAELSPEAQYGKQKIKEFQQQFEPYIISYFDDETKQFTETRNEPHIQLSFDIIKDITTRDAKRVRAAFVYFTYKLLAGKTDALAIDLGIIIELFHAYILMVDDFMDMSDKRRGKPTAHVMFHDYQVTQDFHSKTPQHLANSFAMLTSMMCCHMAEMKLAQLQVDEKTLRNLMWNINEKDKITAFGQYEDILNTARADVTYDELLGMLRLKTGVYTYENPIHCGALLANVSDQATLDALTQYAIPGGIAFQIWDDVLGMFGDPSEMGKSAMDDLKEGKYTLLIHKALENGTSEQKETLRKYLGKHDVTEAEHAIVKKIIEDTGSYEYSKQLAKQLVTQAQTALTNAKQDWWNKDAFDYLIGIASYTVERAK